MQKKVPNKRTLKYPNLTKNSIPELGSIAIFIPKFTLMLPHKIYGQLLAWKYLTKRRLQKYKILPKYEVATGGHTTPFFRRKIKSNWQLIYPIRYMASFRCGNTLIKGDFEKRKTYQNIWRQQAVRHFFYTLKNLTKLTAFFFFFFIKLFNLHYTNKQRA